MKNLLLVLLITLSVNAFAQHNKYPYKYRLSYTDLPSFYYFTYDTTNNYTKDTTSFLLNLNIIDKDTRPSFAIVKLVFDRGDTLELTPDYFSDVIKKQLPYDDFKVYVFDSSNLSYINSLSHADLHFYVCVRETISKITVIVGGKNIDTTIPRLESKRPLTEKEIIEIIYDISNGKEDSKLINDGTCKYSFEI